MTRRTRDRPARIEPAVVAGLSLVLGLVGWLALGFLWRALRRLLLGG